MRTHDIIRRAAKNLRQAKARTILTSLAIGVGAFTITIALAAGNGGRNYTNEMVQTSGDAYSLNVYPKIDETDTEVNEGLPEYGVEEEAASQDANDLTEEDIEALQKLEGVQSITPALSFEANYATLGGESKKFVVPVSVKADRTEMKLAAGALEEYMLAPGEAIIPEGFLASFGFETAASAIGKTLYINVPEYDARQSAAGASKDFAFTIVAVDRESDTTLYYQEAIRIASESSQEIYAYQNGDEAAGRYYGLVVLAKKGADIAALQQAIKDDGYQVYSIEDTRESLLQVVNIAQWGLAGFGALAILASVFGIINTQYISVLERTQHIGLMKALGARSKDVGRLFLYEAAWVGLLGGTIGVVLAFFVTLLNPVINTALELGADTQLLLTDWVASGLLIVGLMVIAVIAGYFPARKAAKLDPIEALRTE